MNLIVETVDGETFVEVVISDRDLKAIENYDFLTKQAKVLGKYIGFAIRRTTNEEE